MRKVSRSLLVLAVAAGTLLGSGCYARYHSNGYGGSGYEHRSAMERRDDVRSYRDHQDEHYWHDHYRN